MSAIERLTPDAVALTFAVPEELASDYEFVPGQHVTLRCAAAGDDVRRTYSMCSPPPALRIGVKAIPGGVFSGYAIRRLRVGENVEVMTPAGRFSSRLAGPAPRHRVAIAVGSGITPVMSVMAATLETEPDSRFTLIYGHRDSASALFGDEIAEHQGRFSTRLAVLHVLSRETGQDEVLCGRLDATRLARLMTIVTGESAVDEWFLCTPMPLMDCARALLRRRGVPDSAVRYEVFHV